MELFWTIYISFSYSSKPSYCASIASKNENLNVNFQIKTLMLTKLFKSKILKTIKKNLHFNFISKLTKDQIHVCIFLFCLKIKNQKKHIYLPVNKTNPPQPSLRKQNYLLSLQKCKNKKETKIRIAEPNSIETRMAAGRKYLHGSANEAVILNSTLSPPDRCSGS